MRFFVALFLAVISIFTAVQVYRLFVQNREAEIQVSKLKDEAIDLTDENVKLSKDILYFQNPVNATKELQSKSNYHQPDEKMIILVPPQ
jgi:hypothetical protein